MIKKAKLYYALFLIAPLIACTSIPTGPSLLVLPGSGKSFEAFRNDDYYCRQFAELQSDNYTPYDAATESGVESAILGSALGAATGAAFGGGRGAAIGAGIGLLFGSLAGVDTAAAAGGTTQQHYDYSYQQCMYTKGNRIPVSGQFNNSSSPSYNYQDSYQYQKDYSIPPPPPGLPPPPPPNYR